MKRGRVFALASGGLVIACGIIVACGGDSSDTPPLGTEAGTPPGTPPPNPNGDGGTPPPPPISGNYVPAPPGVGTQLCADTYGAVTSWYEPCCSAADKTTQDYALVVALLGYVQNACGGDLENSITKGRVAYDPALLAQCKQQIDTLLAGTQCGGTVAVSLNPLGDGGVCTNVFQGSAPAGAKCAQPYECGPGTTCVGYATPSNADAGPPLEGTCVALPALDGGCGQGKIDGGTGSISFNFFFDTTLDCAPGGYCSQTTNGKCVAQKAAQGSCFDDKECQTGLHCYLGKCDSAGPSALSGPCSAKSDCQDGLYCNRPNLGTAGTCQTKLNAGSGCVSGNSGCKGRCVVPDGGASDAGTCQAFCSSG
jgi:hypothetical protein